ncbi:MAG: S-methyl-5-thioribose-1-phosphate isomerase [Elusimicrobia bacterium]|nr:S-methyl-5-thioribose-1-phosphate isomerase [Elusimicrobiota bacterium]
MTFRGTVLDVLDQRLLPGTYRMIRCRTHRQVAECIRGMAVRGAPAIGCAAAFGLALAAQERRFPSRRELLAYLQKAAQTLRATRPTAVNLAWAVQRILRVAKEPVSVSVLQRAVIREAERLFAEDQAANRRLGDYGATLLSPNNVIMTYCNTGSLATAGYGTALGVVRSAFRQGKVAKVLVCETRPYLQGARLTAWELRLERIPCELITDNMAAFIMTQEHVDAVIVGADRVAANGDVANKIGTYALAILAKVHQVPFYVAAPTSTLDPQIASGAEIPIEERPAQEVTSLQGVSIAPPRMPARHPAFDVTPASYIAALVTERGIAYPPYGGSITQLLSSGRPSEPLKEAPALIGASV